MTRVKLASVRTFPHVAPNKAQALKVLEEASETVEAFKKWLLADGFQKCNTEKVPADWADAEFADLIEPEERTCYIEHIDEDSFHLSCGHEAAGHISPSFCPYCGAKVVE